MFPKDIAPYVHHFKDGLHVAVQFRHTHKTSSHIGYIIVTLRRERTQRIVSRFFIAVVAML